MRNRGVSYITYGQIGFAFFLVVCVSLHPGFVFKANEGGLSNYGIHIKTAFAYTFALGLPSLLTYCAVPFFDRPDPLTRRFRQFLRVYSLLVLLTLLSTYPYSLDVVLRDIHIVIGSALIVLDTVGGVWMYRWRRHDRSDDVLVTALLLGFVLAALTITGLLHILFVSQVVTSGAFAISFVRTAQSVAALAGNS
jgi:hypothetical protein